MSSVVLHREENHFNALACLYPSGAAQIVLALDMAERMDRRLPAVLGIPHGDHSQCRATPDLDAYVCRM
eukprot:364088-Rhodomonas_salina.1